MSFVAEEQAIRAYFIAEWKKREPSVPIQFVGVAFTPSTVSEYVAFYVLPGEAQRVSLGDNARFRFVGVIQVSIYIPDQRGQQRARAMADSIAEILWDKTITEGDSGFIKTFVPKIDPPQVDSGMLRLNISVDYWRDYTR